MVDIIKKIKKMEREETSPLDSLLGKEEEPEVEEQEDEKIEVTHYGRTVAGETESTEETAKRGFQDRDLEAEPQDVSILKSKAFQEFSMEDLSKEPDPPPHPVLDEDPAGDEERVIELTSKDETTIKHIKLICHLLEQGFFEQAVEAVRELESLT